MYAVARLSRRLAPGEAVPGPAMLPALALSATLMTTSGTEVSMAAEAAEGAATEDRGRRKIRTGEVISDKMNKTVVVKIDRRVLHPERNNSPHFMQVDEAINCWDQDDMRPAIFSRHCLTIELAQ